MNEIIWEKFENSVNKDLNTSKLLMIGKFIKDDQEEQEEDKYFKSIYDDEDDDDEHGQMVMQFPITQELMNNINLCGRYECWVGHANFDITEEIVFELNYNIPGVEYFKPLSRYRFLVGIGKAFDFRKVRVDIDKKLGVEDGDE